ncbi:hypothetical protein CCMA1212_005149 [Trichoderma ghanense]|uniref:Uncharacterized protein n=1 Tax=Trichoderma ghanense TaxID=65468 RepID=A0ABY2H4X4_9HYPO
MGDELDGGSLLRCPPYEHDTRFDIVLVDEDPNADETAAELKSSFIVQGTNLGGGGLIDEPVGDNALTVQCDLVQVIHGTMSEGGSPATLLVFQFAFVPRGNRRRFKEVEINITFSAGEVSEITPKGTWATLQSEKQQELTHSVSPGLEAGFGSAKATMGYTWELKETQTIQGRSSVVGSRHSLMQAGNSTRRRMNNIFWGLYENPQTKSGIPSFMQAAALMKGEGLMWASQDQTFSAEITIRGTVETHDWFKGKWASFEKKMSSKGKEKNKVVLIPEKSTGSLPDTHNLMKVNLNTYKQLVTIRQWEDGDGKPSAYGSAQGLAQQEAIGKQHDKGKLLAVGPPDEISPDLTQNATRHSVSGTDLGGESNMPTSEPAVYASERATTANSTPQDALGEDLVASLSAKEKQQRLSDVEEELSLVRNEAKLVSQLLVLAREERKLLQKRKKLRGFHG